MLNLIRMYNQNRFKIWIIVIAIIIAITIIQVMNQASKENDIKDRENRIAQEEKEKNTKTYKEESQSMVSGGTVSESKQNTYGNLIDKFFTYCINGEPENAYDLISLDCKKVLYPSEKVFEELYYKGKFDSNKKYSFQSWVSSNVYNIYLVKVYDNMLTTGKDNTANYLQDYITIVEEDGEYKINVSGFVGIRYIQKSSTKDNITVAIKESYIYMDYEIFNLEIVNASENTIKLIKDDYDSPIYIVDSNEIKFNALLNENVEDDFIIEKQKKKNILLKFSDSYRTGIGASKINFSSVIKDYERYKENVNDYEDIIDFEIKL